MGIALSAPQQQLRTSSPFGGEEETRGTRPSEEKHVVCPRVRRTRGSRGDYPALTLVMTAAMSEGTMGLVKWPFMPASRQACEVSAP